MSHQTSRIVVLVDMDCFYCQVEQMLNPELKGKPVAVVQYNEWRGGGIIAVNYEARAKGVTRHMRGNDAKEVCSDINLVKVPQIRGKADLNKYRNAGKQVADVLQTFTPLLERASVDEAYLDITEAVDKRIQEKNFQLTLDQLQNTFVVGSEKEEFISSFEDTMTYDESKLRLAVGGIITEQIRAEVYKVTGYRCSAGVAHNKILAKLVCGLHKPNKQTVLPQDAVSIFFEDLPIKKIKGFGGKFGEEISQVLKITTMGELSNISEKELAIHFDEKTSAWIYNIARGIDNEPVTVRLISKSIGCSKNFLGKSALVSQESVEHWLEELISELLERLEKDLEENNRKAKNMIINFTQNGTTSSRTCQINSYEKSKLMEKAMDVLTKNCRKTDGTYKITHLGFSLGNFEDVKNVRAITSFFKNMEDNKKNKQKIPEQIPKYSKNIEETIVSNLANNISSFDQAKLLESSTFLDSDSDSSEDDNSSVFSTSTISDNIKSIKEKVEYFEKIRPESILDQNFPEYENPLETKAGISSSSTDSIGPEICKNIATKNETKRPSSSSFFEKYFNENKDVKREFDTSKIFGDDCELEHFNNEDLNEGKEMEIAVKSQEKIAITNDFCKQESPVKKYDSPQRKIINIKEPVMQNILSENNGKESCLECGKFILLEDLPSHKDYHFALKIVKNEAHLYHNESCSNVTKTQNTTKNTSKKAKRKSNDSVDSITPISKFFVKENPVEIPLEESELCTECKKRIKFQDLQSHFDYHAAKRLHLELNSENSKPKNPVHIAKMKTSTKEKTKVNKSGTSITSFFKKC